MRDIKGYEGLYAITSCGRVWSYRRKKFLKPRVGNHGYEYINLHFKGTQETVLIHRLVAEAYIPNPDNLPQVNHKDEVKTHNWINNLEWCDRKYNMNYGTRNKRASKRIKCIETGQIFDSIKDAAVFVNRHPSTISAYLIGKSKTSAGYHWELV